MTGGSGVGGGVRESIPNEKILSGFLVCLHRLTRNLIWRGRVVFGWSRSLARPSLFGRADSQISVRVMSYGVAGDGMG